MDDSQTDETGDDAEGASASASMQSGESLEHRIMFQLHNSPSSFRHSPQANAWP